MLDEELARPGAIGAFAFLFVFGTLTALRLSGTELATSVQSLVVTAGGLVLLIGVAVYAYGAGEPLPAFLVSYGACAGFTMNLFLANPADATRALAAYGLLSGAVVAGLLTLFGYVAGRAVDVVTDGSKQRSAE